MTDLDPELQDLMQMQASFFAAYFVVLQDWQDYLDVLRNSAMSLMALEHIAGDPDLVAAMDEAAAKIPVNPDAEEAAMAVYCNDEAFLKWRKGTSFVAQTNATAASSLVRRHDDFRWFVQNALLVGLKGLFDGYLNNVIRLTFMWGQQNEALKSPIRMSWEDLRQLNIMAEDAMNQDARNELRSRTDLPIRQRLEGLGVKLPRDLESDFYRFNRARNIWVHETEFATPRLYQGNIVMWASGSSENNRPTPYPSLVFSNAYRVVSLVAEEVHTQVFRSAISDDMARAMIRAIGLDDHHWSTWDSPFYALA